MHFVDFFSFPYTQDHVKKYERLAKSYTDALRVPPACPQMLSGTDSVITDFLFKEYYTPMMTLKVSCCNYPAVENLPYIWRDMLTPVMTVLNATRTGTKSAHGTLIINAAGF